MLAPGVTLESDGTMPATIGAAQVADFINEGIGFMNDGSVAIDTDAPSGENWRGKLRLNASGAIYGTTTTTGTLHEEGVRISDLGQLIYEAAAPQAYVNGNPIRTNGALAVS